MTAVYDLANAPCSWGVDFVDRPENPAWTRVLDEAAAAGFRAVDLGPVGYFPTDPSRLAEELNRRGLRLSAGGLFDPFTDAAAFSAIVDKTRRTCEILQALDTPRLVIIDGVSPARGRTAGQSERAVRLSPADWRSMMGRMAEVARLAKGDYGVNSYLHAHAGCYVEFEDEIDRAMSDLPQDLVGLCVDTGHSAYASIDPVALIRRYAPRVGHMHFKNIHANVRAACVAEGVDFFGAITRGIFCPLDEGVVDFASIRDVLAEINYSGVAVVEQDVDPGGNASPLKNATESFNYLKEIGIA